MIKPENPRNFRKIPEISPKNPQKTLKICRQNLADGMGGSGLAGQGEICKIFDDTGDN